MSLLLEDRFIAAYSREAKKAVKQSSFTTTFQIQNTGEDKRYLGLKICHRSACARMNSWKEILSEFVERFAMLSAKPCRVHVKNEVLMSFSVVKNRSVTWWQAMGTLVYKMFSFWLELTINALHCSQRVENLTSTPCKCVKIEVRCVGGIGNYEIQFWM